MDRVALSAAPMGLARDRRQACTKGRSDPVTHTVSYFSPVPTLAYAGQVQGPYSRPFPGTFGNIERNSLFGPGLLNTDLALAKKFFITEKLNFQLTAQAFNVFNHPNLNNPSGCVDCGTSFGTDHGHCRFARRNHDAPAAVFRTLPVLGCIRDRWLRRFRNCRGSIKRNRSGDAACLPFYSAQRQHQHRAVQISEKGSLLDQLVS